MFFRSFLIILFIIIIPYKIWSYYTVLDSGQILSKNKYRSTFSLQDYSFSSSDIIFSARFDTFINESSEFQALVGINADFIEGGIFYKWVPFPDYKNQPAIGLKIGAIFLRSNDQEIMIGNISPLISKKISTANLGFFDIYCSLPLAFLKYNNEKNNVFPVNLVIGTKYENINLKNVNFISELGINFSHAFNYFSIGFIFYFE